MFEIKKTSAQSINRVFGLICGRPGIGKTSQLATLPTKGTIAISVEKGFLSLAGSNHYYVEINKYEDLAVFLGGFEQKYPSANFVFIDSLTEIYEVIKAEASEKFSPSQNFQKHDEINNKLFHLLRICRDMKKCSVVFTSNTKDDKDGLAMVENLSFDGKLPSNILGHFDFSLHLTSRETDGKNQRVFCTSPEISKCAKVRISPYSDIIIKDFEEANLHKFITKLKGEKDETRN